MGSHFSNGAPIRNIYWSVDPMNVQMHGYGTLMRTSRPKCHIQAMTVSLAHHLVQMALALLPAAIAANSICAT